MYRLGDSNTNVDFWCLQRVSIITFIRYTQAQTIRKLNKLKVFEYKKKKIQKIIKSINGSMGAYVSQNRLLSPVVDGGEPWF